MQEGGLGETSEEVTSNIYECSIGVPPVHIFIMYRTWKPKKITTSKMAISRRGFEELLKTDYSPYVFSFFLFSGMLEL